MQYIKPTPILTGKDAERFLKSIKENETKTIPQEEFDRMMKNYYKIKALVRFDD